MVHANDMVEEEHIRREEGEACQPEPEVDGPAAELEQISYTEPQKKCTDPEGAQGCGAGSMHAL